VVGATIVVGALDLGALYGVKVLGPLPEGLPGFVVPWIGYGDLVPVLLGRPFRESVWLPLARAALRASAAVRP
jgi:hypothetical protein